MGKANYLLIPCTGSCLFCNELMLAVDTSGGRHGLFRHGRQWVVILADFYLALLLIVYAIECSQSENKHEKGPIFMTPSDGTSMALTILSANLDIYWVNTSMYLNGSNLNGSNYIFSQLGYLLGQYQSRCK